MKTVAVLGIGRVGLPLALVLADVGFKVIGVDVRQDHVETIAKGKMPFIEEKGQELLERHLEKNFFPTTDAGKIAEADYVILTLGTPVDEHLNPDYKQINSVLEELHGNLKEGQTIILRSTVAPGTLEYIRDKIEAEGKFKVGSNIFLAFCPERIAEGKAIEETRELPQIIGGLDEASSKKARELFENVSPECLVTDAKSAELAKIFTNMYRYINFSIANEFLILAEEHKRDIYEILHLVNHNYKRGGVKSPGFTAGPCLYKDGFFLINAMPFSELISVSWKINETLPIYLLKKIQEKAELKHKKVALLGMSFKAGIDDTRNSLSFKIRKALIAQNASVECHDPHVKEFQGSLENALKQADVVIIAMNHAEYKDLNPEKLKALVGKKCLVCDVWNLLGKGKILFEL